MKILAIMGSPHGMKGNTGRLLEEVLAGVQQVGGKVELVSLAESKVLPCVSCYACHKTGTCVLKDDFEEMSCHFNQGTVWQTRLSIFTSGETANSLSTVLPFPRKVL